MSNRAIVKSVLSGDTVILRGKELPEKGKPAKERVMHLAGLSAPRVGSASREDEPFSFASREYLRALLVGKEVAFNVTHTVPGQPTDREYGTLQIAPAQAGGPPQDVSNLIVKNGWAKVREHGGEGDEAIRRLGAEEAKRRETLRSLEGEAKNAGLGVWAEAETQRTVSFQLPADTQAFINEHKGREIDALVEQVRDGSSLRVRLLLDDEHHQFVNLQLAGAKSPRASSGPSQNSEPWGEEAKYFVECRLLQRPIKVQLLSAPVSLGAVPFATAAPGVLPAPQTAGSGAVIGTAVHPNGNIAEFLAAAGLAKVIDWHAGILAPLGGLDRIRSAEKSARDKRLGIWESLPQAQATTNGKPTEASCTGLSTKGSTFDASVVRIWSSDQVSVVARNDESGKERRVQLASLRGPRGTDPKSTFYAGEAKEFLRKRLIGKNVKVHVDYVKPRDGEFEERECVTITYGGANTNVSEQLIEKGLATVLRHRREDEDRSMELDKLIIAEQTATTEAKGMHSDKEAIPARIVDASETGSKAAQFLPSWKRAGRHAAVVDFVAAGSRFKLLMPKESKKLTFVLAGIRAPRTARNANEKSEPYGPESHRFASKFMQRDVEIAFDSVDKQGGFIGAMYANGANVAVELVKEGLATVHGYTAEALPFGRELMAAEEEAKKAGKNIWKDYSEEDAQAAQLDTSAAALPPKYIDVYVSAVKEQDPFSFSVQTLEPSSVESLERLMSQFALHHKSAAAGAASSVPKTGDLVSAKFSEDNQWYRARVKRSSAAKKEAELYFIDYGNEETAPFSRIRPLDAKFKSLPGQAKEARLSFVKLPALDNEYGLEARQKFQSMTEGRKLVANVDAKEGNLLHLRLIDPSDPLVATDPLACLNADIAREGLAVIDKSCRYAAAYPQVVKKIQDATDGAKQDRLGMFEFGDVSED